MRKLHTTLLGVVCLFATSPLFSQGNSQAELERQMSSLYRSSSMDAFMSWFTSPTCSNLLFFLLFLSGCYFLAMFTLFLLVNKEVIRVKENALVQIFLEDWLTEKEKILLATPKIVETPSAENVLAETINQLDLPNLDILSMETESAKMAVG